MRVPENNNKEVFLLKIAFYAICLILWCFSLALVGVGVFVRSDQNFWEFQENLPIGSYYFACYLIITAGVAALVLATAICFGIYAESYSIVASVGTILAVLATLDFIAAGLSWGGGKGDALQSKLEKIIDRKIEAMTYDSKARRFMDLLQLHSECCGSSSRHDYVGAGITIPQSCSSPRTNNVYFYGCSETLRILMERTSALICGLAIGHAFLALVAVVACIVYIRTLKKFHKGIYAPVQRQSSGNQSAIVRFTKISREPKTLNSALSNTSVNYQDPTVNSRQSLEEETASASSTETATSGSSRLSVAGRCATNTEQETSNNGFSNNGMVSQGVATPAAQKGSSPGGTPDEENKISSITSKSSFKSAIGDPSIANSITGTEPKPVISSVQQDNLASPYQAIARDSSGRRSVKDILGSKTRPGNDSAASMPLYAVPTFNRSTPQSQKPISSSTEEGLMPMPLYQPSNSNNAISGISSADSSKSAKENTLSDMPLYVKPSSFRSSGMANQSQPLNVNTVSTVPNPGIYNSTKNRLNFGMS